MVEASGVDPRTSNRAHLRVGDRLTTGLSALLFGKGPLIVVALSAVVPPRERLARSKLIDAIVGFAGLAVVVRTAFTVSSDWLHLLAAAGAVLGAASQALGQIHAARADARAASFRRRVGGVGEESLWSGSAYSSRPARPARVTHARRDPVPRVDRRGGLRGTRLAAVVDRSAVCLSARARRAAASARLGGGGVLRRARRRSRLAPSASAWGLPSRAGFRARAETAALRV